MQNGGRVLELVEFRRYVGTGDNYSITEMNAVLGAAERVIIHVVVSDSEGTTPTLTVYAEDSSDTINFKDINGGTPYINAVTIATPPYTYRAVIGSDSAPFGRYLRLRFVLAAGGGSTPAATMTIRASLKSG